jgi:small-conductance mechanosensitive channel
MNDWLQTLQELYAVPAVRALLVVVGAVVLAKIVDLLVCRVLLRLTLHTDTDLDERVIGLMHRPIFITVMLVGLYFAAVLLELDESVRRAIVAMIQTFAVMIWTVTGLKLASALIGGLGGIADRVKWIEMRTVPLFDNLAKVLLLGGAVYCLLVIWGLDVKPWLASAGIVGIAVGFAAKDSLANLFGGMFIIVDAPYQIGDYINLDSGERGQVTSIGLRSTRLLTRNDLEITVPNAQIANAKIINESGGRWVKSRVTLYVSVAYGSDVDRVREVLLEVADRCDYVLKDPAPRVRFTEMGDSALIFRLLCWIGEPVQRGRTIDALNTAVYKVLTAEGINIPFPQREVHLRQASTSPGD